MKLAQATPRCGPPSWKYLDSLVRWANAHALNHPDVPVVFLHPERILPIDVARNLLVEQFLRTDADYLWCLDARNTRPADVPTAAHRERA